jgi:undecaprenyl-diphosphatase
MSQVDILVAMILGIFQGGMEWLPISSTGQTILAMVDLLKIDADSALSFAFFLHFGTLMAVLLKFRGDVKHIIVNVPKYKEDKMVQFIAISTMATAAVGIPVYFFLLKLFDSQIQGETITALVGIFLIVTGIIIYLTKKKMGTRNLKDSNYKDSLLAGIGQGFTVIPGVSRSGVTVAALISKNFKQEESLHLSFLMSIPAITGIIILETLRGAVTSIGIIPIIAGVIVSFILGYLMIDILLKFAKRVKFDVFCVVFGMIAIAIAILVIA